MGRMVTKRIWICVYHANTYMWIYMYDVVYIAKWLGHIPERWDISNIICASQACVLACKKPFVIGTFR
jgi:hypothetical protein